MFGSGHTGQVFIAYGRGGLNASNILCKNLMKISQNKKATFVGIFFLSEQEYFMASVIYFLHFQILSIRDKLSPGGSFSP